MGGGRGKGFASRFPASPCCFPTYIAPRTLHHSPHSHVFPSEAELHFRLSTCLENASSVGGGTEWLELAHTSCGAAIEKMKEARQQLEEQLEPLVEPAAAGDKEASDAGKEEEWGVGNERGREKESFTVAGRHCALALSAPPSLTPPPRSPAPLPCPIHPAPLQAAEKLEKGEQSIQDLREALVPVTDRYEDLKLQVRGRGERRVGG